MGDGSTAAAVPVGLLGFGTGDLPAALVRVTGGAGGRPMSSDCFWQPTRTIAASAVTAASFLVFTLNSSGVGWGTQSCTGGSPRPSSATGTGLWEGDKRGDAFSCQPWRD